MIEFEKISEEQQNMMNAVNKFLGDIRKSFSKDKLAEGKKEKGDSKNMFSDIFTEAMSGELAQYFDMVFSTSKTGLPIKTNTARLLMMYGNRDQADGIGLPKNLYTSNPAKYGLTAMGLAAISSGPDGRKLIMEKYLPELMAGKTFCYCITEPDAGTNTHKISTTAISEGDFFKLSGQKTFISAADASSYMVVIAKIISEGQQQGIGTFVVDSKSRGISITPLDIAVLGDRQFSVYFDNVILPKDSLVGEKAAKKPGGISGSVFYTLNLERIMIALILLRACREALDKAVKKAKQKRASGPPLGSYQEIKQKLAKVKLKYELASLATKKAAEEYDKKGTPQIVGMYANMAKLVSTDAAIEACDVAMRIYGVEGLNKDSDIGPLYQIARLFKVAPINNEMVLNFLGEHLLGLPKSYR